MKINSTSQPKPQPIKVCNIKPGDVYRLMKHDNGSQIDETNLFIRNEDSFVVPKGHGYGTSLVQRSGTLGGIRIKSSTVLNNGTLIIHDNGHESCWAFLMDAELVVKGEQI